jgi:nitrite reductase (NADH) large subunit
MEGGLDYLREVIVDDKLGICEQLEEEMKGLIESYHCEWKKVVDNPELQKQYKHFINSEEPDPALAFVEVRKQKLPANWGK